MNHGEHEAPDAHDSTRSTEVREGSMATANARASEAAPTAEAVRRHLVDAVTADFIGPFDPTPGQEEIALVAAGALRFADAVRAVRARGQLMQSAVPEGQGAMAAIIGVESAKIVEICGQIQATLQGEVVVPANFNSPEQIVISGTTRAVDEACRAFNEAGAQKTVLLPVSAPFHSPLMEPAARGLRDVLEEISVGVLDCPVVTNVDAAPNTDETKVKDLLVKQVTAPVRWTETIRYLADQGESAAFEIGPGKVLMGLARRIDRRLKVTGIQDAASLEKALSLMAA